MSDHRKENRPDQEARGDIIFGRNPVSEAIRSGRAIDSILVTKGAKTGAIVGILAKAKEKKLRIKEVDSKKLDYMCAGATHQGIAAVAAVCEYKELEDIFALAESKGESPFVIILDEIEDPHNLGAIIRTRCSRSHHSKPQKRRPQLYRRQNRRRCYRICSRCACTQHPFCYRDLTGKRSVGLRRRYERRGLP